MKLYTIDVEVHHTVEVEAQDEGEAEELALDQFLDEQSWWDEIGLYVVNVETLEEEDDDDDEQASGDA